MNKLEPTLKNKRAVANEIVMIFKKIKKSIILGFVFFIGFSVYNNLVSYTFFEKDFTWFEAEEILGFKPNQYYFVSDKQKNVESKKNIDSSTIEVKSKIQKDFNIDEEIKKVDDFFDNIKTEENISVENSTQTGSIEISEEDKVEVKKEIIKKLFEDSILISLIMIPIFFIFMLLFDYINTAIKWTKKYAN